MEDETEALRRGLVKGIAEEVVSNDPSEERKRLEKKYGQVWDTKEVSRDFDLIGFMAPYVVVTRKETGTKGTLMFQHMPRFYFWFKEEK